MYHNTKKYVYVLKSSAGAGDPLLFVSVTSTVHIIMNQLRCHLNGSERTGVEMIFPLVERVETPTALHKYFKTYIQKKEYPTVQEREDFINIYVQAEQNAKGNIR